MKNRKHKIYYSSYRKQLIQLAKLYGVVEIKNYFRSAKKLTTAQIELILIKNRIKLPIQRSLSRFSRFLFALSFKNEYVKQLYYVLTVLIIVIGFFGGAPHLVKMYNNVDYNSLKNEKETAKKKKDTINDILKKNQLSSYETEENNEFAFTNKQQKQEDIIENTVSLNASTIATLFEDYDYDLKKIRKGKKVKPFYISLLPKDLSSIESNQERKELFIKIVLPLILQENDRIEKDRKKLFKVLAKKFNNKFEKNWLKWKFKEYKIDKSDISELKIRMDIIPVSLAIAQAAKESGWGTSRFALEGNALYGQWTWSEKGLEPSEKQETKSHKVMQFKILKASVKAYKNNLNTHGGYAEFREARANLRIQGKNLDGLKLSQFLDKYAQTGKTYTKTIELIIKQNSLSDFDKAKLLSIGVRKGTKL